jgi:hypothetical protein
VKKKNKKRIGKNRKYGKKKKCEIRKKKRKKKEGKER